MPEPEELPSAGGLAGLVGVAKKAFNGVITTMSETGGVTREDVDKAYNNIHDKYMDSVHAMPALKPGHGQHLIKGDDVHFVSGSRIAGVHGNDFLRVNGEQSHEIDGNAVFLYNGLRDQETKGDEAWVVMGTRKCYVLGESEDNFFGKHDQHAPESFEWKHSESSFVANQVETLYYGWSFYAQKTEIGLVDNDLSLTGLSFDKLHVKAEEIVSGIKEMLEDEAAMEAVENPTLVWESFMWATQAITATVGAAVESKNWIGDKAGQAWSFMKAHPVASTFVGVVTVADAVGEFFVGPEVWADEPAAVGAGVATEGAVSAAGTALKSAGTAIGKFFGAGGGSMTPAFAP